LAKTATGVKVKVKMQVSRSTDEASATLVADLRNQKQVEADCASGVSN
jgi:hypothetical protein